MDTLRYLALIAVGLYTLTVAGCLTGMLAHMGTWYQPKCWTLVCIRRIGAAVMMASGTCLFLDIAIIALLWAFTALTGK